MEDFMGSIHLSMLALIHVIISLIGIVAGLFVVFGFLKPGKPGLMNTTFLVFTILTDITGYLFFPFHGNTPAIDLGVISLIVLAIALFALMRKMATVYIIAAALAEFFNVFVLIVQSFQKIPALHKFAPTGKEPIVGICQLVVLVGFIVVMVLAIRKKAYVLA
jgi:hypothetical protein